MRWVFAAVVAVCSATASAQSIAVPAGFVKQAGGDADFKTLASPGDSIEVQAYRGGDVELTTVHWLFKPEAESRAALAQFERALAARTIPPGGKQVSDAVVFDRDPMLAEAFEVNETQRIYHRRLYAVDANGRAHLWWTICTGTASSIGPCEQAQRTMKLDVPHAATMPAFPPPSRPLPVPASPPAEPARPWSIVVPQGYVRSPTSLDKGLKTLRAQPGVFRADAELYDSPDASIRLVLATAMLTTSSETARSTIDEFDHELGDGPAPVTIDNNLVSEKIDDVKQTRTVYAIDEQGMTQVFSASCVGARGSRSDCVAALATMRLAIPGEVSPEMTSPPRSEAYRIGRVLGGMVVPSIGIGLALRWLGRRKRERLRRGRRGVPESSSS
jgi:hypothetical protein